MEGIYLTEDELWALSRCRGWTVKAYLHMRMRMDIRTGIVGQRTKICTQSLTEWMTDTEEKGRGEQEVKPSKEQTRGALRQLERRGLIRKVVDKGYVFLCPMARLAQPRPNQTQHKLNTEKQGYLNTPANTNPAHANPSSGAGFDPSGLYELNTPANTNPTQQNGQYSPHIGDGVNNYPSQAAYTEVEAERAREAIAALGLAKMSQASPPAMPESKRRVVDLVLSARQASVPVTSSDPRVIAWAAQGVTPRQLEQAIGIAKQRRAAEGSRQAINAGYLDAILRDILNPPERPAVAAAWWSSVASMDAKARELGIATARPGESEADYKNRIRSALMRSAEGDDGTVGVTA